MVKVTLAYYLVLIIIIDNIHMAQAKLKTFIEAPMSANLVNFIKQRCISYGIDGEVKSEPLNKDWLDKLCGINRETVYLDLSGSELALKTLCNELKQLVN